VIAALLVTHNSQDLLPDLLSSIDRQTRQPDIRLAIDDNSTDATRDILRDHGFSVESSSTDASDLTTRIAQNFVQGVMSASSKGAGVIVLGDHDDFWHPHRIAHQNEILQSNPAVSFVASNGRTPLGTLRTTFPVAGDFNHWDSRQQWRYVAKHSIATGGASALVPDRLGSIAVPDGWLHDRWWSLRAVREGSMWIDPEIVIDYRVSPNQQVGLDASDQGNRVKWAANKVKDLPSTLRKMKDIAALLSETKSG
jgi:glycosyltransferase involved in cell wall biosynthesis